MNQKPRKPCNAPYCPKLIPSGQRYCDKHKSMANKNEFANKKAHPFYNHKAWKGNPNKPLNQRGGLRAAHLLSNPFCVVCHQQDGVYKDITAPGKAVVDHIKPFNREATEADKWEAFTDPDNLQTLCKYHHDSKTGRGE